MPAAIHFQSEAYATTGPRLMGRQSAGEAFLRGYFGHARIGEALWAQVPTAGEGRAFAAAARTAGRPEPVRLVLPGGEGELARAGTLYYPAPGIGAQAWARAAHGQGAWSLCGITHTTASARAMDAITDLVTAPVAPWDAVICTSTAVKDNVERLLGAQIAYLKDRLGRCEPVLPRLPVIPLGIHAGDFAFTEAERAAARQTLGAGPGTVVVLFVGRLSFHAKAHPLAMYQALEQAVRALPAGGEALLVACGWYANDAIADAFREGAVAACPSVRLATLDGRRPEARRTAWAGADIFCSLSDNIQETFGLTPVEAMAAGLPVVVSDWDGYRDTVRHGLDGLLVPTVAPPPGLGGDLALRHALGVDSYDQYCGLACALVSVDVGAAAQAFVELFAAPELRRRQGEAGRVRARTVYDWSVIIPRYEALWEELAALRLARGRERKPPAVPWPARMDPFTAFAAYPSLALQPATVLELVGESPEAALARVARLRELAMVGYAGAVLPTAAEVAAVLTAAAAGPTPAGNLVAAIAPPRRAFVFRALVWLLKLGVLRLTRSEGAV